ncbi:MAG TPA: hypothetical protein PK473_03210 [Nitrosomonas sp.]|nr:hypothetical protein [Agitococcus sp.]HNA70020.1 hypothetical protein [Nitrosomonas sp.]
MNGNKLAKIISELEGKKKQVNIAQIKEVLMLMKKLFNEDPNNVLEYFYKK